MRSLFFCLALAGSLLAQSPRPVTYAERTASLKKLPGFVPLYWDAKQGKLWMEVERLGQEFLLVTSLPAGVGSNDIGLDRGQLGSTRIVRFERIGPKVLLVQPNHRFRATSDNPDERQAVTDAFAQSVLAGFSVEAEQDGRVLVDATPFFLQDLHGVAETLRRAQQGTFRLDMTRSAVHMARTKSFPKNTEVEVMLTFTGDQPGGFVREVVPTPEAITVRQHHSLVELPDAGYRPRRHDPRAGYFGVRYLDYGTPIGEPITQRLIARHRLRKKNPNAAVSEPVEPIVYYLDRGVPEPIRSALLDGARWWDQAFQAAGYRGAFRVELLPDGEDPMDVRYNIINWVHRSTRGWSYGSTVTDPRTGEIIKGQVTLGSLRVRQDYLIAEGLLAPHETGKPASKAMEGMALARLRQLAAHEVGHTLGLAHNYISSAQGRASVMDYPHPLVGLGSDGAPGLEDAYAVGIGEWDKVAINYGYQDFPAGTDETGVLTRLLADATGRGLTFFSDQDARPEGSAHPSVHLWDNGKDAVLELQRVMQVRARALERFGERNVREGAPLATLEEVLVPLYLGHRYQVEAAAKVLGGVQYTYAHRGDGQTPTEAVPVEAQRRALDALLATLQPLALTLPERLIRLISPRPLGYERTRETFPARTGLTFDPLSAAESAATLTLGMLLHPERAARLVEQQARERRAWGLPEVMDALMASTWKAARQDGLAGEVQRRVEQATLTHLLQLAASQAAPPQVKAIAEAELDELRQWASLQSKAPGRGTPQKVHLRFAAAQIARYFDDPRQVPAPRALPVPPGQPIGCDWE